MSKLKTVFAVLANNSKDIEGIINQLGGVAATLRIAPSLIRIIDTINESKTSPEEVKDILVYSDQTRERVRAFQLANGLKPDGLVGDYTWTKVEELLKKNE